MSDVLFGNNNKAVIKKVANRSFHSNKKRNILAVIAIALTTFLLTAVLTIGFGAKNTMQYSQARLLGSQADALVQGMTKEQAEQLKECSANGKLNQSYIYAVLLKKESSKINVTIPAKKIGNYFPETYSKEQIEEVIFMLLDKWKENKEGVADAEDTV